MIIINREKINLYIFIVAFLIITGCSTHKDLHIHKEKAEVAEAKNNFSKAVEHWEIYFKEQTEQGNEPEGKIYAQAAKTAHQAGLDEIAVDWFNQARYSEYSDKEMYLILVKIFKKQDNLSKELSALEYYIENFGKDDPDVNDRLFSLYFQIDQNDKALNIWKLLPEKENNKLENLDKFFEINKQMGNEEVCNSVSLKLLEIDPEHTAALEWNAQKYYSRAESHYQNELEKYEKNKTMRQYRLLLKELDQVTADFKRALGYFEKLWEQDQNEKYAGYLANIHTRLNNKEKSEYYRKFLE